MVNIQQNINANSDDRQMMLEGNRIATELRNSVHYLSYQRVDAERIDELIDTLQKKFSELNLVVLNCQEVGWVRISDEKNLTIYLLSRYNWRVEAFLNDLGITRTLNPILEDFKWIPPIQEDQPEIKTHYYYRVPETDEIKGYSFREDSSAINEIIPEMWPGLDAKKLAQQYRNSDEKILIFLGIPGLGKTTLIKYIMGQQSLDEGTRIDNAYVKDPQILESDFFWISTSNGNFEYMVLDDLDFAMLPRTKDEKNPFVSKILSYSEGIIKTETKIVITTNKNMDDIDSAMVRPGRCFDVIRLKPMKYKLARSIWNEQMELAGGIFDENFKDREEISQAFFMSVARDIFKNNEKTYLLDQSMSARGEFV